MPAAQPSPDPFEDADPTDAWERALLDRQLERLDRLADMGMAIAAAIEAEATGAEPGPERAAALQHASLDFARVSRAVRQTFALQSRLIADHKGKPAKPSVADEEPYDGPLEVFWLSPDRHHTAIVQDAVRRAAEAEGHEPESVERLVLESAERLERDDIWGQVTTRPFDEIVALVCRDLGLEPEGDGEKTPRPLDGVRAAPIGADRTVGSGGDGSAAVRPTDHPHPRPFPHQGGREQWPP